MRNPSQVKKQLYDLCQQIVDERIELIKNSLKQINASKKSETKSSAGDKYETGRAMLQIEEDNYKKQLHQAQLLKNQLEQINISRQLDKADTGSLVITNRSDYFISVGLGEITLGSKPFYCISPASPIGRKIMNQQPGLKFEFNGYDTEIREIF